jgi:plastocyanin
LSENTYRISEKQNNFDSGIEQIILGRTFYNSTIAITSVIVALIITTLCIIPEYAYASPYALQNQAGSNSTNATSGNTGTLVSSASTGGVIVTTDKTSYNNGDTLTISGSVPDYISDTPVTIKIIDPKGDVVKVDQVDVKSDRTFSTTITDDTGILWQTSGTYQVTAIYGSMDRTSKTTFQFSGSVANNTGNIQQIQLTSGGTLQVGFSTDPINPTITDSTQLKINFMNKQDSIQQHVDYKVSVIQGSSQVFGMPLTHTALGLVSIPIQFQNSGTYQIIVEVDGVLFQPIPPETATFSLQVGTQVGGGSTQTGNTVSTPLITVSVDKPSYMYGDIITVIGTVQPVVSGTPVTIQIFDTNNNLVSASSVDVSQSGKYVSSMTIAGPYWKLDGIYTIKVQYGPPNFTAQTTFAYASHNPYLPCPDCNDTSNIQQMPPTTHHNPYLGCPDCNDTSNIQQVSPQPVSSSGVFITMPQGAGSSASAACVSAKNCFSPNTLNVASGTTVTWKNMDTVSHYVTSGNPSDNTTGTIFDSGNLIKPGGAYQFTFANAGTYNYFCTVHPWMIGQVIVGSSNQPVPYPQSTSVFTPTQQDIQSINQAKSNQTIAAEVNVGANQAQTTSIDNNVSVQTTSNTPDSLNVNVSASSQTGPKVIAFNLNATTINVANLKDLGVMYDGKLIQPVSNMDAILHAKPTDNPSFAIVVTQSGVQVLVLVPHFSTHTITLTNMSKVIPAVPEFGPIMGTVTMISIIGSIVISRKFFKI